MRPQWAVCSCKNYSVTLISWAATAFLLKLPHVLVCSVSPNCFLEGGRWKGSSVFYIYISTGRGRQSWLFCDWSVQPGDGFSSHEMPFSPCGVLRRTGSWQKQHLHSQLPNSPLSSVLLLIRSRSTEADHPLLLCKWHNCRRDYKCPSLLFSLSSSCSLLSFFSYFAFTLLYFSFPSFHPSPSHLFPLSRATLFTLHLNFPS